MMLDKLTEEANYFTLLLCVAELQQEISPAQYHGVGVLVCADGKVKVMAEGVKESLCCQLSQNALHVEIVRAASFDLCPVVCHVID